MSAQVNQMVIYIYVDVFDLFIAFPSNRLGTGHYLSPGGGRGSEGFGAKQGEIWPIHPLNVTSLKCCP